MAKKANRAEKAAAAMPKPEATMEVAADVLVLTHPLDRTGGEALAVDDDGASALDVFAATDDDVDAGAVSCATRGRAALAIDDDAGFARAFAGGTGPHADVVDEDA